MSSEGLHAPRERLSKSTIAMHHAIVSLMEELEAVDWYNQRVDACKDAELKRILEHNRDEEKEHAAMVLEWIRRRGSAPCSIDTVRIADVVDRVALRVEFDALMLTWQKSAMPLP